MAYQSSYTGAEVDAAVASAQTAQQPPVEGAFVNGDKTKLDGIEALADVTDTANVAAAGALMDSEVANLAAVKSFDPTDYATAAQGATADTATQPGDLATVATTGAYGDLSALPTLGTAAATAVTDYATAAQGALADTALQPSDMVGSVRTLWVDPAGDDAADGDLPTAPLQTVGAAVAKSEPGDIIRVRSGTYTETCPLILPRDVSVFGDGLRNVEIRPTEATKTNNMWLVDSGAYLWGMTFARHQAGSFAVAFNAAADNTALGATSLGAFISKSPYIQNCSSYTAAQDAGTAGSTSVGATGGGMEVDGAKCALNSPIRSMVVDSYTQVNLNGLGCIVKNDAYAQLVSFFGTFCSEHVRAESGGQVNLSNSTTNFGTYGLVADGRSTTPIFSGTASAALDAVTTITVDSMTASRIGPSSRPAAGMVFEVATATYTVTGALPNGTGWDVNFYPTLDGALSGTETVEFFQRSQISTGGHVMEFVGSGTNYNALPWFGGVPIPANEIVEGGGGRVFFSSTDQLGNFRVGPQFDVNGTTGAVTINTDQFNLSGLNAIGPFSRDGFTSVGVQLREISNNTSLLSSTGAADGNTAPTQFAVKTYLETNYTLTSGLATVATTGAYGDLSGLPTLGTAAATAATDYATAAQGGLADSAVQPDDLSVVATSGAYGDLSGLPTLGTAAATDATAYATAAQGALADSAIQLGDLAPYALETYVDSAIATLVDTAPETLDTLNELANALGDDPNFATTVSNQIGTKLNASAYTAADVLAKMVTVDGAGSGLDADLLDGQQATAFATAAQGALANSAVQPSDLAAVATTGAYGDLSGLPTLGTAAAQDAAAFAEAVHTHLLAQITDAGTAAGAAIADFATAAQGGLADSAMQPDDLSVVATSGAYSDLAGLPTLGTAAATDATAYATAAQGSLADSAVQPSDLAAVATSGAYSDLSGLPTLGTAASLNVGISADQVVQLDGTGKLPAIDGSQLTNMGGATGVGDVVGPASAVDSHVALFDGTSGKVIKSAGATLATVATTGAYFDLSGLPTLGTLASQNADAVAFTGSIQEGVFAVSGTAPVLDPANGTIQTWTLSGASTPTDGLVAGEAITVMVDDGTANTITWPTMIWVNNGGSAPTLATTGYTVIAVWKVGTTLYGAFVGNGS